MIGAKIQEIKNNMSEEKKITLAKVFENIDNVRLAIIQKGKAQYQRAVEHRNQTLKKQQEQVKCDKLKREFQTLLADKRYEDFLEYNELSEKLLIDELKNAVNKGSNETLNIAVIKMSAVLEWIEHTKNYDKKMRNFLEKIKK